MTRNSFGGNKTKSYARKHINSNVSSIRLPSSDEEFFVVVSKLMGGNICRVIDHDNNTLQCHIRGKFSSKFKHSNLIMAGSILLVGKREWEKPPLKNCDVLEIYDYSQLKLFDKYPVENNIIQKLLSLVSYDNSIKIDEHDNIFSNNTYETLFDKNISVTDEKENDEIDVNDI